MLNNKTFRIIASLVIAVLLWAYVIGTRSTNTTEQISNIPITLTHTVELNERGLAVSSMNLESIDVEVTGSRVLISDITSNDVTATVDLATAAKGENELNIAVKVPSSIRVNDRSASKVTVMVEDLIQKQVDVVINYTGTFDEGQEGDTVSIATPQITVSGAESMVNMVTNVRGTIDASRLSGDITEITCQLQPVNNEGNTVSGVVLSQENVTVKSILSETRGITVDVEIIDNSSDGLVRNTEVPSEVLVVGRADVLDKLETIKAKAVDISNIGEAKEIPLEFELPEGVSLSDRNEEANLKVKLEVNPVTSKSFTFDTGEIVIEGMSDNLHYQVTAGQVVATALDSTNTLSSVSKGNIKLKCDVSTLTATGTVTIVPECDVKLHGLSVNPAYVEVTVTSAGEAQDAARSNSNSTNNSTSNDATNG